VRIPSALLIVVCICALAAPAGAEILIGVNGGAVIPGGQDMTLKEYGSDHLELRRVETDKVHESIGPFVGASLTGWADWSFLRYFGLQLDAMYWYMKSRPDESVAPAPRFEVGQHRTAFFLSALGRLPLYPLFGRFSDPARDVCAYAGGGIGAVYSTITHGSSEWDLGYQLLGGFSVPVFSNVRVRLESRWLLTSDVDTSPSDKLQGWKADVSGTPTSFRRSDTMDTRFFPIIVGVDWRF
jgi:hypothetical protein